jgi:Uma2 family endonuclease
MRAPDGAWTSKLRFEALDEATQERFLPFCPEFVVELRSPSDRASRVEAKMEYWTTKGAQLGWLVDPQRKLVMIYRPGQEPETLMRPEFLEGEGPIAGFRLKMQRFWE